MESVGMWETYEREIESVSTWSQWVCEEHEREIEGVHMESVGMWGT